MSGTSFGPGGDFSSLFSSPFGFDGQCISPYDDGIYSSTLAQEACSTNTELYLNMNETQRNLFQTANDTQVSIRPESTDSLTTLYATDEINAMFETTSTRRAQDPPTDFTMAQGVADLAFPYWGPNFLACPSPNSPTTPLNDDLDLDAVHRYTLGAQVGTPVGLVCYCRIAYEEI
jgi:hypothetical protein